MLPSDIHLQIIKPEHEALSQRLSVSAKGLHLEGNNLFFGFFFFKQMAVARSIFTLDGGFQLFCAAFDMPITGVALKVALGYKKIVFWAFQKIIMDSHLTFT